MFGAHCPFNPPTQLAESKVIDNSFNALDKMRYIEIDQIAKSQVGEFEICHQLGLIKGDYLLHGLELNNNTVLDDHVRPQAGIHLYFMIYHR